MASIPPPTGRDRNEAVLKPDVIQGEGGAYNPSDLPPIWRNTARAVEAMKTGYRLGQPQEQILDAMYRAADGDAEAVYRATGFGREVATYDSADRPGRYGSWRPAKDQAAALDREAQGAAHLGDALMAAPYEAAKWLEMNTPLKPLSLVGKTVRGGNWKLDSQLEAFGLPTTQVLAMHYLNNGSDSSWPFLVDETTSSPSLENVMATLRGGYRQLSDPYQPRKW